MALALVLISATSANGFIEGNSAADITGTWDYEVTMPDGSGLTGEMKIAKAEGDYEVTIFSDVYGKMELEDVTMEKNTMEATFEIEGETIEFVMEFDGDSMEGIVYSEGGEIEITAEKQG